MSAPIAPEAVPMVGPPQPPVMPWTPFAPMPTDTEPAIAALRRRRLARLIDSAKFEGFPPEWQQVAFAEYERMRSVEAAAAQPQPAPGQKPEPQKPPQPGAPE